MMRNLIVLGCAGLLAIGLSITSFAGVEPDTDLDGVADSADNCSTYANGPSAQDPATPLCAAQEDGNADGYGNPCDSDLDGDFAASLIDVSQELAASQAVSTDPQFDMDCDGGASLIDLSMVLADSHAVAQPGPSGLACAGTASCP
jgi:hypothetical protein